MSKTYCKSKKTRKDRSLCSLSAVPDATHICRKCGRLAVEKRKKKLCKASKLS